MTKDKKLAPRFRDCRVKKRSRQLEKFSESKLKKSLLSSGLSPQKSAEVMQEVAERLRETISSAEIQRTAGKAILRRSKICAANYNIKRAIYDLGPDGFSFEKFCAEMLKAKGFETQISVMKHGMFVTHEVDIVAERKDGTIYVECKFHNKKYHKSDIKVPLYIYSRSLDIKLANPQEEFQYAIFTNTKFSLDAISYAKGVNLLLYSLNYPEKDTFLDIIQRYKVYPVTVLKTLRKKDQRKLLDKGVVVVKQIDLELLTKIGLEQQDIRKILKEVKILTRPN